MVSADGRADGRRERRNYCPIGAIRSGGSGVGKSAAFKYFPAPNSGLLFALLYLLFTVVEQHKLQL